MADTCYGGAGRDSIFGDDGNDKLYGDADDDFVDGGTGRDEIYGGTGANKLFGGLGDDILASEADELGDLMYGGPEDDRYFVADPGDKTIETGDGGNDTVLVQSAINWTLASNVENLTLLVGNVKGTGNGLANTIKGSTGDNTLSGLVGNDTLSGDAGKDKLIGGGGKDHMTGGTGADIFDFNTLKESVKGAHHDTIYDFSHGEHDKIDLRTIDANSHKGGNQAFHYIGGQAFHHKEGELHCIKSGGGALIQGDVNGDGRADFEIKLDMAVKLVAGDFFL